MTLARASRRERRDAEEHFELHVASILRTLPPRQRAYAKIEIDRLLYGPLSAFHFPLF